MSSVTNGSRRKPGEGSVFQRTSDHLWVAATPNRNQPGTPKYFYSKFREVAELKRALWLKRHDMILRPDPAIREIDDLVEVLIERLEPVLEEMIERALARHHVRS